MSRKCVPQLAVDERMVALFRIIDPDIESSGKHIDECRQIDPRAVDAAYGSREMQCRFQFHDIRRRELLGEEQRRFGDFGRHRIGDGRIAKPGENQADLKIRQLDGGFQQRGLQRVLIADAILQSA